MDKLPNELVCMIGEHLTRCDLHSFSCASQRCWGLLEPLLYRLHALRGNRWTGSALVKAVEFADRNKPGTQATSLAILDKVSRFCRLDPAVLNQCRPTTRASSWFDSYRVARLAFPHRIWTQLMDCPSLSPLHVAALKGLVDIVSWLLDQGASVDAPIPGSKTTALSLAVVGNHVPTALLLLANHADPDLREGGAQELPAVLHLVCTLGLTELADGLLTAQYVEVDPTELLGVYQLNCPSDASRFVTVLVRHGAEVSEDMFWAFLSAAKFQSAWELLASPMFSDHLTVEGASCMLWAVLSLRGRELAKHVEMTVRMLRHLLDRGANPDLGRFLWRQSGDVSYPVLLKLLPPLLEAGMDVKPAPSMRRRARRQPPVKYGVNDLLGHTSPYDESQDDEGAAAQLEIIRLLLQHGAPIGGATRGDSVDSYPLAPEQQLHGRAGWSYKLCQVLLDHCNNTLEDERGEDVDAFLNRLSKVQDRKRGIDAGR